MDIKTSHNLNTEEHIIVHLLAWVSSVWQVESWLAQVIYPKDSTLTARLSVKKWILLKININALRSICHFGIIGPKLDLEKPQGLQVWKGTEALVRARLVLNASRSDPRVEGFRSPHPDCDPLFSTSQLSLLISSSDCGHLDGFAFHKGCQSVTQTAFPA